MTHLSWTLDDHGRLVAEAAKERGAAGFAAPGDTGDRDVDEADARKSSAAANQRITDALSTPEADQDSGGEGDADSEPTA